MASEEIFRATDLCDTTASVMDRDSYLKFSVAGSAQSTLYTFLDPADVVRLRDALSDSIERNGWV